MLQSKNAYAIMPLGKNDVSVHVGHVKKPGVAAPGFFYSVWARWLIP